MKLHITAQSGPVILVILCHSRIDPPKGGPMILVTKTVCVCVCVFIKLHITAQSGPVILVESFYATRVDPPKGGSMILVTKTSDQARQRGHTLSTCTTLT